MVSVILNLATRFSQETLRVEPCIHILHAVTNRLFLKSIQLDVYVHEFFLRFGHLVDLGYRQTDFIKCTAHVLIGNNLTVVFGYMFLKMRMHVPKDDDK